MVSMYKEIINYLDQHNVDLVAVSKTKSPEEIQKVYSQGQRHFGENRVNELTEKKDLLPQDIKWHMIGHLQKNKVKYIAPFIHLIHSVDSLKLAQTIDGQAERNERNIDILLQIKIASEESKFGLSFDDLLTQIQQFKALKNIRITGLMGMGTFTNDQNVTIDEFQRLKTYFDELKSSHFNEECFNTLSMGMSGDYKLAVEFGTTMVRIGSLIFGSRN
ncbi:MAG: YggS family pyridoxal phosphate-dependent enzyme [Saprospiraceae bacterium]|nr:YggS family pyridoxal phosphate-dependent enzyme [Saprospiraceae bacterium]